MCGPPPHAASPPSPISEGLEGCWSSADSSGRGSGCSEAGESYHLDLLASDECDSEDAAAPPALPAPGAGAPLRSHARPLQHVWDGMRAASAAMPTRRNTWA